MKVIDLLNNIILEIQYIRTHTDEHNVLAECNIIENMIKRYLDNEE